MAGSVNKVILVGNLGKDPEIRSFANGGKVASFSIATSESWKDKASGEKKERTEWHRISVLNENLVTIVQKYLKKGMKVYIEGQLETRKWTDKDGQEKYVTEVVLRPFNGEITMLEGKGGGSSHDGGYMPGVDSPGDSYITAGTSKPKDMPDDEIPF